MRRLRAARALAASAAAIATAAVPGVARADAGAGSGADAATPAPTAAPGAPTDLVARPLGLRPGELALRLVGELGVRAGELARPLSLAPDAWLGVAPRWTLGIVHSRQSLGLVGTGASLCLRAPRERAYGCDRRYAGSGVEARWAWREGPLAVAPRARLLLRDVDPWKPAVTAGALVRWTRGRYAIATDAYLRLGLANRDRGNRAALVVPLWLALQPLPRLRLALHTGWDGELAVLRDGWHVPIAIAVDVRAGAGLEAGAELGFRSLLGPQSDVKSPSLAVWLGWRR